MGAWVGGCVGGVCGGGGGREGPGIVQHGCEGLPGSEGPVDGQQQHIGVEGPWRTKGSVSERESPPFLVVLLFFSGPGVQAESSEPPPGIFVTWPLPTMSSHRHIFLCPHERLAKVGGRDVLARWQAARGAASAEAIVTPSSAKFSSVAAFGIAPWPAICISCRSSAAQKTIETSPPGPLLPATVCQSASPVATAPSKALPPDSNARIPAAVPRASWLATIPNVPVSSGRVVNGRCQYSNGSPFGRNVGPRFRQGCGCGWPGEAVGDPAPPPGARWPRSVRSRDAAAVLPPTTILAAEKSAEQVTTAAIESGKCRPRAPPTAGPAPLRVRDLRQGRDHRLTCWALRSVCATYVSLPPVSPRGMRV